MVATGLIGLVGHQVEPEGGAIQAFDRLVDVGGQAEQAVGAQAGLDFALLFQRGQLGYLIDGATG